MNTCNEIIDKKKSTLSLPSLSVNEPLDIEIIRIYRNDLSCGYYFGYMVMVGEMDGAIEESQCKCKLQCKKSMKIILTLG